MIVSTKVFGQHVGRSKTWVCKLVKDMESMGYKVSKDGRTVLIDDKDAFECIDKRSKRTKNGIATFSISRNMPLSGGAERRRDARSRSSRRPYAVHPEDGNRLPFPVC